MVLSEQLYCECLYQSVHAVRCNAQSLQAALWVLWVNMAPFAKIGCWLLWQCFRLKRYRCIKDRQRHKSGGLESRKILVWCIDFLLSIKMLPAKILGLLGLLCLVSAKTSSSSHKKTITSSSTSVLSTTKKPSTSLTSSYYTTITSSSLTISTDSSSTIVSSSPTTSTPPPVETVSAYGQCGGIGRQCVVQDFQVLTSK